jgi:hypothetical protein
MPILYEQKTLQLVNKVSTLDTWTRFAHLDEMRVLSLLNVKDCAFILLVFFFSRKNYWMVDVAKKNATIVHK